MTNITLRFYFMAAITLGLLFSSLIGAASGDNPVHSTPELAGISTVTSIDTQGIAITSAALSLQLGSDTLDDPPLENGGFPWEWGPFGPTGVYIEGYTLDPRAEFPGTPVPPGEVQYTAGYNEGTSASSGNLNFRHTMTISTANKASGENNIKAERLITFIGYDGGRMTSSEDSLIDGTGGQTVSAIRVLCPYGGSDDSFFPPFSNIVMSASSADISGGSLGTSSGMRFVTASTDLPVEETYGITMEGVNGADGYSNANGTVSASLNLHLQEGIEEQVPRRFVTDFLGFVPAKAEDISYSETATASGSIGRFTKNMQYQSGVRLV